MSPAIGCEFEPDVPCSTPARRRMSGVARYHVARRNSVNRSPLLSVLHLPGCYGNSNDAHPNVHWIMLKIVSSCSQCDLWEGRSCSFRGGHTTTN